MSRSARIAVPTTALDQDSTLVVVLELSARSWLAGARVPGVGRLSRYALPPAAAGPTRAARGTANAGGDALPANAAARIGRVLDRLELVVKQIAELEQARNAVVTKEAAADEAEMMIRSLARPKGVGAELASVLVREAYVRTFPNRKALGAYAGLTRTPFASGGTAREQGISKAGNRRLRSSLVELAWLWLRYQPSSTLAAWFRGRTGSAGGRMRKVMIVALARKLLVALWRFCREGVLPEGATLKAA